MKRWLALLLVMLFALSFTGSLAEEWKDSPLFLEESTLEIEASQAEEAVPEEGEIDLPLETEEETDSGAVDEATGDASTAEEAGIMEDDPGIACKGIATTSVILGVKEKYTLPLEGGVDPLNVGAVFTSSKPKIVSVNASTGVLTGKKAGTAVITVDVQGTKTSCTVTVRKAPKKITLSSKKKTLGAGEQLGLKATLPKKTASALTWTTDNPGVAVVDGNGVVTAVAAGKATISVRTFNKKKATCIITVKSAPEYVSFDTSLLTMWMGRSVKLSPILSPGSGGSLSYTTSNASVAVVDGSTLRAVGKGNATITVRTYNGCTGSMQVQVSKAPVYRALLVGESFSGTSNALPSRNDVSLLKKTLKTVKGPSGSAWKITQKIDRTASQIYSDIQTAFAGAEDGDISLFYISTHGDIDRTFEYGDGQYAGALLVESAYYGDDLLPLPKLAQWLAAVPGQVIVLIDSCGSGAAVYNSKTEQATVFSPAAFDAAVIEAFRAEDKGVMAPGVDQGAFVLENKFYVLTASDYMEFSWATNKQSYFTKWVCDGIKTKGKMPADSNKNKITTLNELYNYTSGLASKKVFTSRGVRYQQHIQVYPSNSGFEMFYRK